MGMTPRRAAAIAALVVVGWWATSLRPFSAAATLAVVGAGVLAMAWGFTHRRPRTQPDERRGVGVWLLLAAILAAWQLAAYVQEPRSGHPTLSSMANAALEPHAVRALACAGWLLVAARLAAR
jgi:hypothetical protein